MLSRKTEEKSMDAFLCHCPLPCVLKIIPVSEERRGQEVKKDSLIQFLDMVINPSSLSAQLNLNVHI